jgi:hypothetical protein
MKTNKTLLWVGIGSALLIGGGLFWWFKNKPKTDENKEPVKDEDKSKQEEAVIKTETDSTAPSLPSTPFKNKAEGDAFRAWMSVNHSDFRYKGDVLDKSGDYDNSFMRVAYDKYGKEYSSKTTDGGSGSGSTNFDTVQKNLGLKANGASFTVNFNGGKNKATFFNNNRFSIGAVGQTGFLKKGSYSNGGLTFAIDGGSTFSSGSVWGNLLTALK